MIHVVKKSTRISHTTVGRNPANQLRGSFYPLSIFIPLFTGLHYIQTLVFKRRNISHQQVPPWQCQRNASFCSTSRTGGSAINAIYPLTLQEIMNLLGFCYAKKSLADSFNWDEALRKAGESHNYLHRVTEDNGTC